MCNNYKPVCCFLCINQVKSMKMNENLEVGISTAKQKAERKRQKAFFFFIIMTTSVELNIWP